MILCWFLVFNFMISILIFFIISVLLLTLEITWYFSSFLRQEFKQLIFFFFTMFILTLVETEPLRRIFPKVTQQSSGDSNPGPPALYLHCPLEFSVRIERSNLCCPIQQPLATCGCWALEMWLVQIEKCWKCKTHTWFWWLSIRKIECKISY